MKIELIILQDSPLKKSFKEKNGFLYYISEMIIKCPVKIHTNISDIDFEKEVGPTYYLLFCFYLDDLEELVKYSHKMILMNAIYPDISKTIRNFNFAGMVSLRHIIMHYPMMFGLHAVIKNMNYIPEHQSEIHNEKYGSIYRPDVGISEMVHDYLLRYHEYMTTNNNQNLQE